MKNIFLSHASQDKDTVRQIASALSESGLNVWFDEGDLHFGDVLFDKIASAIVEDVDVFCVVLTATSITKPWVREEISMALASELADGHPRVVGLLLQNCEVPVTLRHKLYVDFRGRFNAAIEELRDQIIELESKPAITKQAVIATMIRSSDDELWKRLTSGSTNEDRWSRSEFADLVQMLTTPQLEGVVAVGSQWTGQEYKWWESDLLHVLKKAADTSAPSAKRLLKSLVVQGFLEPAEDLDYRSRQEAAWCDTSALWLMRRAARRSGLFPALPAPMPERLSEVLAYDRAVEIISEGWYAIRFSEPVKTDLSTSTLAMAAVVRADPPTSWIFRSADDRQPLSVEKQYGITALTPDDPYASLQGSEKDRTHLVGFALTAFDDLGILTG